MLKILAGWRFSRTNILWNWEIFVALMLLIFSGCIFTYAFSLKVLIVLLFLFFWLVLLLLLTLEVDFMEVVDFLNSSCE